MRSTDLRREDVPPVCSFPAAGVDFAIVFGAIDKECISGGEGIIFRDDCAGSFITLCSTADLRRDSVEEGADKRLIAAVDIFWDDDLVVLSHLRTGGEIIGERFIACDVAAADGTELLALTDFLSGDA